MNFGQHGGQHAARGRRQRHRNTGRDLRNMCIYVALKTEIHPEGKP